MIMISPFDDEMQTHASTRLDRDEPARGTAVISGGGAPVIWAGNLATVEVRASDEPINSESAPINRIITNQNQKTAQPSSGDGVLLWLVIGIGAILLLAKR
jgi:hypothetical protein